MQLAHASLALALAVVCSLPTAAQSFNIDCGANGLFPLPAATYAAAGIAGPWNNMSADAFPSLVDVNGAVTGAAISISPAVANYTFDNVGTTGDDELLMDDIKALGSTGVKTVTVSGLANGNYVVRVYAWAPDNATYVTSVSVAGGSGAQNVGGAWPGSQTLGTTYAQDSVVVAGGTITFTLTPAGGHGSWNGVQIERVCTPSGITAYCTAKLNSCGTLPIIGSSGDPSATSRSGFLVTCSNARASAPNNLKNGVLVYSVTGPNNIPFQGGFLCVAAQVKRTVTLPPAVPGTPGLCNAMHQIDFNAFTQSLIPGQATPDAALELPCQMVWAQWYARDLQANGPLLSGGLRWVQQP